MRVLAHDACSWFAVVGAILAKVYGVLSKAVSAHALSARL